MKHVPSEPQLRKIANIMSHVMFRFSVRLDDKNQHNPMTSATDPLNKT